MHETVLPESAARAEAEQSIDTHARLQVIMNVRRKSTVGWSIHNVLLDFTGGFLSVAQLLMQCAVQHDWTQIAGNPVKFGLGFVSLFFDVIFMAQHYIIYDAAGDGEGESGPGPNAGTLCLVSRPVLSLRI